MVAENHLPPVIPLYQHVFQGLRAYAGNARACSRNAAFTLLIPIIRSSLFGAIRLLFACGSLAMGLGRLSALPRGEIWQDLVCGRLSGALNPVTGLLVLSLYWAATAAAGGMQKCISRYQFRVF